MDGEPSESGKTHQISDNPFVHIDTLRIAIVYMYLVYGHINQRTDENESDFQYYRSEIEFAEWVHNEW